MTPINEHKTSIRKEMADKIGELLAEIAALRMDKERLDWLDNVQVTVHECMASDQPLIFNRFPTGYGPDEQDTLRGFIDAARSEKGRTL